MNAEDNLTDMPVNMKKQKTIMYSYTKVKNEHVINVRM